MAAHEPPDYPLDGHERAIADAARCHPRLIWYAVHWANDAPPADVLEMLRTLRGDDPERALDDLVRKTVDCMSAQGGGPDALLALLAAGRVPGRVHVGRGPRANPPQSHP